MVEDILENTQEVTREARLTRLTMANTMKAT